VFEQIHDADGMSRLPGVLDGNFRGDVLQACFEVDLALFLKFQKSERDESFADGSDAKLRVTRDGLLGGDVRVAKSAAPEKFTARDERDACAGHVIFLQFALYGFLQAFKCLARQRVGLFLRNERNGRQQDQSGKEQNDTARRISAHEVPFPGGVTPYVG
jgi:hypothetical protein